MFFLSFVEYFEWGIDDVILDLKRFHWMERCMGKGQEEKRTCKDFIHLDFQDTQEGRK